MASDNRISWEFCLEWEKKALQTAICNANFVMNLD